MKEAAATASFFLSMPHFKLCALSLPPYEMLLPGGRNDFFLSYSDQLPVWGPQARYLLYSKVPEDIKPHLLRERQ